MLTGFTIEGRCYAAEEELTFFPSPKKNNRQQSKIAVVYGRNGTGKSTISQALTLLDVDIAGKDPLTADLDTDGYPDATRDAHRLKISPVPQSAGASPAATGVKVTTSVFNELYIDEQVKIRQDGLETVVLFGKQVELEDDLGVVQAEISRLEADITAGEAEIENMEAKEAQAYNRLKDALKRGWAKRQQRIRSNSGSTPVTKGVIDRIRGAAPRPGAIVEEVEALNKRIDAYLTFSDAEPPARNWDELLGQDLIASVDFGLPGRSIEAPSGVGVAASVADSLKRFGAHVHLAKEVFDDPSVTRCPFCQKSMSSTYRDELLQAIVDAVDESARRFADDLEQSKLKRVELAGSMVDERLGECVETYESARLIMNREIEHWNAICEEKKKALYSPLHWDSVPIRNAAERLATAVDGLELEYERIVEAISLRNEECRAIEELNHAVSRLELDMELGAHADAAASVEDRKQCMHCLRAQVSGLREREADLVAQAQNVHVAADEINIGLRAIFAESDRLKLVLDTSSILGARYFLQNRGNPVSPSTLSVGERNIVAITYFFAKVRGRLEECARTCSSDWITVVLDDPISSVDVDNRLGIHGFIESQLAKIFQLGHENLKVIVLTHDLGAAREFDKSAIGALCNVEQSKAEGLGYSKVREQLVSTFELGGDHKLIPLGARLGDLNEYQALMVAAWQFAVGASGGAGLERLTIGNVARRILEAFSTFIYSESRIPSALMAAEYGRLTGGRELVVDLGPGHRLLLHGGSHSEDRITALSDYGGLSELDYSEQVKHVRKVLAFMHTLQPAHVVTFVRSVETDAKVVLDEWCIEQLGHSSGA